METLLEYDVNVQIGGKLAMLGSRLIDSTASSMATQFFTKFAAVVKKDFSGAVKKKVAVKKIAKKKAAPKKAAKKKK